MMEKAHRALVVNKCTTSEYDVYIGRPTKWGNPFVLGKDGSRADVVRKYEAWLLGNQELVAQLHELRGKRLACFCAPLACHGWVLAYYANHEQEEWT